MSFERPQKTCCWCEFFSIRRHESLKDFDWPDGWCRFNLYQTDELQSCGAFWPSAEYNRLNKFVDMIEGMAESL